MFGALLYMTQNLNTNRIGTEVFGEASKCGSRRDWTRYNDKRK
jgi:hypothetical protein